MLDFLFWFRAEALSLRIQEETPNDCERSRRLTLMIVLRVSPEWFWNLWDERTYEEALAFTLLGKPMPIEMLNATTPNN